MYDEMARGEEGGGVSENAKRTAKRIFMSTYIIICETDVRT